MKSQPIPFKVVSASRRAAPVRSRRSRSLLEPLESRQLLTADLSAAFAVAPLQALGGTSAPITLQVRNSGDTRAAGKMDVLVYAVPDGTAFDPTTATLLTAFRRNVSLGVNGTTNLRFNAPINSTTPTGTDRLVAMIDPFNTIVESNDLNNTASSNALTVSQPQRDLSVAFPANTVLPRLVAGQRLNTNMQVQVSNAATSNTTFPANTRAAVRVVARPVGATTTAGDILLNTTNTTLNVGGLQPGGQRTVSVPVRFLSTFPSGSFNLVATVDPLNVVPETNEVNNQVVLGNGGTILTSVPPTPRFQPLIPAAGTLGTVGGVGQITLQPTGSLTSNFLQTGNIVPSGNIGLPVGMTTGLGLGTPALNLTPVNSSPVLSTGLNLAPALPGFIPISTGLTPASVNLTPLAGSFSNTPISF